MAIELKNSNFAVSTLAEDCNQVTQSSQLTLSNWAGFPQTGKFMAVIWNGSKLSPLDDPYREIVELVPFGYEGMEHIFTCNGGMEGTEMRNWAAGSKVAHVITAGKLDELEAEINLKADSASYEKRGSVLVKTSSYSMKGSERGIIVNAGVSDVVITLPAPAQNAGRIYGVKRVDGGTASVRIKANAGELIDTQSADVVLAARWESSLFLSDGKDWYTL